MGFNIVLNLYDFILAVQTLVITVITAFFQIALLLILNGE